MSWSINTALTSSRRTAAVLLWAIASMVGVCTAQAQDWKPPSVLTAGSGTSITTQGTGSATLYLVGPSHVTKRQIRLGEPIEIRPEELPSAGRYLALLCTNSCSSSWFYVGPAEPANLSFLVHPSRVPVGQNGAISGVVFPFDRFHNLVTSPISVEFSLKNTADQIISTRATTQNGVAWFRLTTGTKAGNVELTAAVNDIRTRRVLQQVASDPCNLRIKAQRSERGILVETEPVRDCGGNPVPDGTIVTFTQTADQGKSTVDAPVKKGVARAEMLISGPSVISAASGVVVGNEVHIGNQP